MIMLCQAVLHTILWQQEWNSQCSSVLLRIFVGLKLHNTETHVEVETQKTDWLKSRNIKPMWQVVSSITWSWLSGFFLQLPCSLFPLYFNSLFRGWLLFFPCPLFFPFNFNLFYSCRRISVHYVCMSLLKVLCRYTVVNQMEPHSVAQNPKPFQLHPTEFFFLF